MTLLRFVQDLENFYNCKLSSLGRVISILNQNDHFILQRGTLYFKIISLQDWLWWIGWGWGGRNDKDTFSKKSYGRTKYFHTNNVKARKGIKVQHKTTKQKKIYKDDWVYLIIVVSSYLHYGVYVPGGKIDEWEGGPLDTGQARA